jgi:hypothetical protein
LASAAVLFPLSTLFCVFSFWLGFVGFRDPGVGGWFCHPDPRVWDKGSSGGGLFGWQSVFLLFDSVQLRVGSSEVGAWGLHVGLLPLEISTFSFVLNTIELYVGEVVIHNGPGSLLALFPPDVDFVGA